MDNETLDIEVRLVFPRHLLDPNHTDDEIVEQVLQALLNEWSGEVNQGVQLHLSRVSEGLLVDA